MTVAIWAAASFVVLATTLHLASMAVAMIRCRPPRVPLAAAADGSPVSLVIPVCGLDNYSEATLQSAFLLDYPSYELIFCAARADEPAAPLVRRLIAEYPRIDARLLIGDDHQSPNPKLNNVVKGWRAATNDWIAIADSNILMRHDYIQRLFAAWRSDTGLVCAPPTGCLPAGFWAELECAFLNCYQARWQYLADGLGIGFAQGKTLFWRRSDLEQAAVSAHSVPKSPRTRQRQRSYARPVCACASSARLRASHLGLVAHARCGGASRAGRVCGARLFRCSFSLKSCQALRRRWRHFCLSHRKPKVPLCPQSCYSLPCGMEPNASSPSRPIGLCRVIFSSAPCYAISCCRRSGSTRGAAINSNGAAPR